MSTVGEILRSERERQGRTLQEVSDALNIKPAYLSAIEADRYEDIPGVVFVKGFIRNYGTYLSMDGAALVQEYKRTFSGRTPQPEVRSVVKAKKKHILRHSGKKTIRKGKWPEITIIAGVVIFLLLIVWIVL